MEAILRGLETSAERIKHGLKTHFSNKKISLKV